MKKALIFGCSGQDGSYLAEILLEKNYQVHGVIRRSSNYNTQRIDHIFNKLYLHHGDLASGDSIRKIIQKVKPDEIYNLAAMSHVKVSFEVPEYTMDIDGTGVVRILESIRDFQDETGQKVKYYQASSSELFGSQPAPQNENTPFHPRSPYACAKAAAYHLTVNYREAYGIHASNGILYNHESPRRGETFVTRKITRAATRIKIGLQDKLVLGNMDAKRDWGYAKEYCQMMWLMLQQPQPDDFVVATGEAHTVREFCEETFNALGLNYTDFVITDQRYYRPAEVDHLLGDASKAKSILGWEPKVKFKELVKIMVEADFELAKQELRSA